MVSLVSTGEPDLTVELSICAIDVTSKCGLSLAARVTVEPAVEKLTNTPDEFSDLDNLTNVK